MSTSTSPNPAVRPAQPRVLAAQLPRQVGARVRIAGWLHRRRLLKTVAFAIIRDRSGLSQVVVSDAESRQRLEGLPEESVIAVSGTVTASAAAVGSVELTSPCFEVLSTAQPPPFDLYRPKLRASLPTRLDSAAVALRHRRIKAHSAIAAAAVAGFRAALRAREFTEVHTPKIVGSATESGANVFALDYFGSRAYLAQSPQFYKQTMVGVFERVFEVGPVFRAEPHDTVRHLAQYTSLDVEFGFIRDSRDIAALLREVVAAMLSEVAATTTDDLRAIEALVPAVPGEIPSVHFTTALRMYAQATGSPDEDADDLSPAVERWLGEWARIEHGSDFVIVAGYPMSKRPFYTAPDPELPGFSDSFDLLFRGTEMVTGGRRLHRYEDYVAAIGARGESPESYQDYLGAFRHGMPPHGGFAIGLERFVAQLVGATNIRDVTLFPRDMHRLTP